MATKIIVISDMHVGSKRGLCPPKVEFFDGGVYKASRLQRRVYKEYVASAKKHDKPDVLFYLGDGIDGKHKRNYGHPVWNTDPQIQAETCADLINMWRARKVYMVHGTNYHVSIEGTQAEEWMARNVRLAQRGPDNRMAPPSRYVKVEDVTFHLGHHIGGTSVYQYRATPPAREMAKGLMASALNLAPEADVILRGHVHHYYQIDDGTHKAVICPCWQLQTDYEAAKNPQGWLSELGFLEINVDGKVSDIQHHKITFKGSTPTVEKCTEKKG